MTHDAGYRKAGMRAFHNIRRQDVGEENMRARDEGSAPASISAWWYPIPKGSNWDVEMIRGVGYARTRSRRMLRLDRRANRGPAAW